MYIRIKEHFKNVIKLYFGNIFKLKNSFYFLLIFELVRQIANYIVLGNNILSFFLHLSLGFLSNLFLLMLPFCFIKIKERTYLSLLSIPLIFSNLIYLVHLFHLKAPFSLGAIAVIAETTPRESFEFMDTVGLKILLLALSLSLLPLLWLIFFTNKENNKIAMQYKWLLYFLIPVFVFLNFIERTYFHKAQKVIYYNPFSSSFIYQDLKQIAYYYREQTKLEKFIKDRPKYTFKSKYLGELSKFNVVLVIGESMSKYHMQAYGYYRKTNPLLSTQSNLFFFNDVISPATQTRESVLRMMSLAKGKYEEQFFQKGSILTAAKESGYHVSWLSNQMILGISDTETSIIAKDANETTFINTDWNTNSLDEKLLPYFKSTIQKTDFNKKMIVLHLLGNHFKYEHRYNKVNTTTFDDNQLIPEYLTEAHQNTINHYDNSIIYTDSILNEIITIAKQTHVPTIVLFASDHGEEVYDNSGLYIGHGSPNIRKEAVDIPFFIWVSPLISDSLPYKNIPSYLNRKYNAQDLFHSLADILHLSFVDYDSTKSIVSPSFIEAERVVLNSNNELINYKDIK